MKESCESKSLDTTELSIVVASVTANFLDYARNKFPFLFPDYGRRRGVYDDIEEFIASFKVKDVFNLKEIRKKRIEFKNISHDLIIESVQRILTSRNLDFCVKAFVLVGVYSLGLSVALKHFGANNRQILGIWAGSLGAPMWEELFFRTPLTISFLRGVGKNFGITNIPEKDTGLSSNTIFGILHFPDPVFDKILFFEAHEEVANERGLSHAIVRHALWNACVYGVTFLNHLLLSDGSKDIRHWLLPSTFILACTGVCISTSLGVDGLKEVMRDKKTLEMLNEIRKADTLRDIFSPNEFQQVAEDLLSASIINNDCDFKSGLILAYHIEILSMKEYTNPAQFNFCLKQAREKVIAKIRSKNRYDDELDAKLSIAEEIMG